jgi:hypothetical protein
MPTYIDDGPTTTEALVGIYERVAPQHAALVTLVGRQALRRPADATPESTLGVVRIVLADVQRLVAREPGARGPLELRGGIEWAGLAAKLALSGAELARFWDRYRDFDTHLMSSYWRTRQQLDFISDANDLDENGANLGP